MKVRRVVIDRVALDKTEYFGRDKEFRTVRAVIYLKISDDSGFAEEDAEAIRFFVFRDRVSGKRSTETSFPRVSTSLSIITRWEAWEKEELELTILNSKLSKNIEMSEEQWSNLSKEPYKYEA